MRATFSALGLLPLVAPAEEPLRLMPEPTPRLWDGPALRPLVHPPGWPHPTHPVQRGLRLAAEDQTIALPLPEAMRSRYTVIFLGLHLSEPAEGEVIEYAVAGGPTLRAPARSGERLLGALAPPGRDEAGVTLRLPSRYVPSPGQDWEAGPRVAVVWVSAQPGNAERLSLAVLGSLFLDVGAAGDQHFLRSGFFRAEGPPSADYRWTERVFEIELPLPEHQRCSGLRLHGFLPQAIASRVVRLTIAGPAGAQQTRFTVEPFEHATIDVALPRVLDGGIYLFRFELEAIWNPKLEAGLDDPRDLGFFLNAFELKTVEE